MDEPADPTTYPEELAFDANLQEFARRVGIICGLESGDKITQAEAYRRIKRLWGDLKQSRRNLRIEGDAPADRDGR